MVNFDPTPEQEALREMVHKFSANEIRPRAAGLRESWRRKAEAGMAHTGLDLGLASEGSFWPHRAFPWLAVNTEWLTFVDHRAGLVITETLVTPRTNFDRKVVAVTDGRGRLLYNHPLPYLDSG